MNVTSASVYIVTPWYGTFAGGAGAMFAAIATMLRRCGISTVVLTTCSTSPYENWWTSSHPAGESTIDGVRVRRFPVNAADPTLYHLAVRRQLDGVHVDESLQEAFFEKGVNSHELIRYVGGIPDTARIVAGPYFQSLVPSLVNRYPGRIDVVPALHDEPELHWKPVARLIANARQLLFLTEEEKALAIRVHGTVGGRRLVEAPVVGLGVELPAALHSSTALADAQRRIRQRLDLPGRYFLYVGRIDEGKGLPYLISWFSGWWQERTGLGVEAPPLVFVGAGNEAIIPPSAAFRRGGFVSNEEKYGLMAGAIALINPSRFESFSYVIMESWLTGRPVMVPAECAVTAGHCYRAGGGIAYCGDREFARGLECLLGESLANALGAAGREYVHSNYAWPDVADNFLRALDLL